MKNNKGMTLIETIIAIMILSVASLMLFMGFSTVMKTMVKANTIKDNSDTLLSYAEKSVDANLRNKVEVDDSLFSYTIKNDSSAPIQIEGALQTLKIKNSESIILKMINANPNEKVSESDSYLNIEANARNTSENIDAQLNAWKKETDGNMWLEEAGYNSILKSAYTIQPYQIFDKDMLPESMKQEASDTNPFYIKTYYPWEYYNSNAGFDITHGGKLIFVSQGKDVITDASKTETLRIVYDYNANMWYSYCPSGADSYKKEYYKLDFSRMLNLGRYEGSLYVGLGAQSNASTILSWDEFIAHIKNPDNGWKVLDTNSNVQTGGIWRDIK